MRDMSPKPNLKASWNTVTMNTYGVQCDNALDGGCIHVLACSPTKKHKKTEEHLITLEAVFLK